MAEYVELYMDQGADFSTTIYINNESNNLPQNVDGYVVTSKMKKSLVSQNATETFVCSISDPTLGEILIQMPASNTANVPAGSYFFDVKINDTDNSTIFRLIEGVIFVTQQITR